MKKEHFYRFRRNNFFFRYATTIFFSLLIPLLLLFFLFIFQYVTSLKRDISTYADKQITSVCSVYQNIFSTIDLFLMRFIATQNVELYSKNAVSYSTKDLNIVNSISNHMKDFMLNVPCLIDIYFYVPRANYVISSNTYTSSSSADQFVDSGFYNEFLSKNQTLLFREAILNGEKQSILTYYFPFYNNNELDSLLVFNISPSKFVNSIIDVIGKDNEIYIFEDKTLLYGSKSATIDLSKAVEDTSQTTFYRINENMLITSNDLMTPALKLITTSSYTTLKSAVNNLLLLGLMLLLTIILSSLLISSRLAKKVSRPISEVINMLKRTDISELCVENEMDFLIVKITELLESSSKMKTELINNVSQLNNAQITALQTQINPHFLFNTLGVISSVSTQILRRESNVNHLILLLSDLLKYSLDTSSLLIDLETELKYSKTFLEIQNVRYDNKIKIEYDIADDSLCLNVVKFTLQPLLENAISHGLSCFEYEGTIHISSKISNNNLYITVTNDCITIPENRLNEIYKTMTTGHISSKNGIGLSNVHNRITRIWGKLYGCSIRSESNKAAVTMTLPITKYQGSDENV